MNSDMKISVIMATYNRQDCIWLPIKAMLNQTFTNWELFIVDDGSDEPYNDYIDMILEDNGVDFHKSGNIYSFGNSRIYLSRMEHQGHPSPVRNSVIDLLDGDLVCFRDDDGYWHPQFLEKMSYPFLTKDVIMSYCWRNISHFKSLWDFERVYDENFYRIHGSNYNPAHTGEGNFSAGADTGDVMLRLDVFKEVGGFGDPTLTGGQEDLFLWRSIGERYKDHIVFEVGEVLNYYIWHKSDVPNRTDPNQRR